jgi:hypothetical protein
MKSKIIKILLIALLQWIFCIGLSDVYYSFNPLKHNDISFGISLHYYYFYLLPIIIVVWGLIKMFCQRKNLIISLFVFFVIIIVIFGISSIDKYPYRTVFSIFTSTIILVIGGYMIGKIWKK